MTRIAGDQRPLLLRGSSLSIWACVLAAVAIVGSVGAVIARYDVGRAVEGLRGEESRRLQFNAERSAAQIESELLETGDPSNLPAVKEAVWLRRYWKNSLAKQPGRLYAAVINDRGVVIAHTNGKEYEGRSIVTELTKFSERPAHTEMAETTDEVLTLGRAALDVRVPIFAGQRVLGSYHTGLDAQWLHARLADERWARSRFWIILISGMCSLLLLSSVAVVRVTRHTARLEYELDAAHNRRVSEMHELVLGVAHEIRNPLNAIRLNLHTIGQVFHNKAALDEAEVRSMLGEMTGEITRLESLMREMLGFVQSSEQPQQPVEIADEIHRTVSFFGANLERRGVQVRLALGDAACPAAIAAGRLRQVLLNLLNNAVEALPHGGTIEIAATRRRGQVEVTVADDGPGVRIEDRERVFVPFYSTKASGTGLGLALARKFIEEAGGTIACEERPDQRGCLFRIVLPVKSGVEMEITA